MKRAALSFAAFAAAFCVCRAEAAAGRASKAPPAGNYAIAVDSATAADREWSQVVEALKKKRSAEVLRYEDGDVAGVLPGLKKLSPRYVCFVSMPEKAGRGLVVASAQIVRKINDDPYADAYWGILTGYEAGDALKAIALDRPLETRTLFTSQGGPHTLDDWDAGFVSDEGNGSNFWLKKPGAAGAEAVACVPDNSAPLADALSAQGADIAITSGHASERDWQVVFNQNLGYLRHENGSLFMFDKEKGRHPVVSPNPKIYMASGNCLIGHIDRRDCMATSWMHSGGAVQMAGYTVPTFYGYMGWGLKNLYMSGVYSFAEAYFYINQLLLMELAKADAKLLAEKIAADDVADMPKFMRRMSDSGIAGDARGLLWERDTVAFYGDPAWCAALPGAKAAYEIERSGDRISIRFNRKTVYPERVTRGAPSAVAVPLDEPLPAGAALIDAKTGKAADGAVVARLFVLIPLKGEFDKGSTAEWTISISKKTPSGT